MMDGNHPRVFDLLHPSPVSLKKITAASIALDVCREEINKYRRINAMNRLRFDNISLDSLLPSIPSTMHNLVEKCKKDVESSIERFIEYHYEYVFKLHHKDLNEVLKDFDDFVVDYDGSIDYCKTAKRVILCDRFSDVEKFVIACQYNFAEEVRKLWPSVSTIINTDEFEDSTHFKYTSLRCWVDRLSSEKNDFHITDRFWGEELLREAGFVIISTMEHFWEIMDSNARVGIAVAQFDKFLNESTFCRFILPKLNEQELDAFMLARGGNLFPVLLQYEVHMDLVFPVWKLVKSKITEADFIATVRKIIDTQTNHKPYCFESYESSDCGEKIWKDASVRMKQLAIKDILSSSDSSIFVRNEYSYRQAGFLLTILSDMTIEERRTFWNKNWSHLVSGTRTKDLQVLMNLCLGSRKKTNKFKRIRLTRYKIIAPCCLQFLKVANYQELDKFLNFCCPREGTRKYIKARLMNDDFQLSYVHLREVRLLDNFIKSTFDDEVQITLLKYKITLKLVRNSDFFPIVLTGKYDQLKEIVDTMVMSEKIATDLKEYYFPYLIRRRLAESVPYLCHFNGKELSNFLRWCFGDDEKAEQFKQALPIDDIVRRVAEEVLSEEGLHKGRRRRRNYDLDAFMEWYFTNPESLAEFKTGFADLFEQIGQN